MGDTFVVRSFFTNYFYYNFLFAYNFNYFNLNSYIEIITSRFVVLIRNSFCKIICEIFYVIDDPHLQNVQSEEITCTYSYILEPFHIL